MRIGIFSLSCCEGCSVEFLNLESKILEILRYYSIVNFRIAMDMDELPVDIAFVEGSPTVPSEVKKLMKIRENSKVLVALGSCAVTTGVLGLANTLPKKELMKIYGGNPPQIPVDVKPISHYVDVDYQLPGCPFSKDELTRLLTDILLGKEFRIPERGVCFDCPLRESGCLMDRGIPCMGPVTKGGCGAPCPSSGALCTGCRGNFKDANFKAHIRALKEMGLEAEDVVEVYSIFGSEVLKEVISWLREE